MQPAFVHYRTVFSMLKKLVAILMALTLAPAFLAGCNTVQGAGQDISKAGNKVQDEAKEHKTY
jgi:predicted small secreted protein